jgi:RpiR family carbohydrate utilization transcriptional regulator
MVSRLLHLLAIDILSTGVALRLGPARRPLLQEIKRNLRERRYLQPAQPDAESGA